VDLDAVRPPHVARSSAAGSAHVCIVILNWNGWRDTIECLESVFRLDYPNLSVIVCDNASTDYSLQYICRWADGDLAASCVNPQLAYVTSPPVAKPIPTISLPTPQFSLSVAAADYPLVLIQTGGNLGFAGGCNVGMQYALARGGCDYVWLLNNDTVVAKDSLSALVNKAHAEPYLGICGSVLLDYSSPQIVQAFGGYNYGPRTGRVLLSIRTALRDAPDDPLRQIAFVHGASMLVRREFLEAVGLMDERYFLFFEELDWAMRARPRYSIGYAPSSFVYHKEGASIGTKVQRGGRSLLSEKYMARNRLLFTRRFYPAYVPLVLGSVGLAALHRLLIGSPRKAGQMIAAAWEGLTCSKLPCYPQAKSMERTPDVSPAPGDGRTME
jgi:GT2 family glycosyltransferase